MSYQQSSRFGRIPAGTVELFQRTVQVIREQVVTALPAQASGDVRAYTLEAVLEIVLRDWRENENTTGLVSSDIQDLRSFVELAASLAGTDINAKGKPIYEATLRGLLEDWLANWNSPNDPGPPGPID
jgi:hypothetical protein